LAVLRKSSPFILGKCACGCGIDIDIRKHNGYLKRFVRFHGRRNKVATEETRMKLRMIRKGTNMGSNNPAWKGGRKYNREGYILILSHEHPRADRNGYVFEHIVIMEKHLGRYLKREEIVHHINHIRDDNRIENLELFASNSAHLKHHWLEKKI
jgi:hypothetical protein